MKNEAVDQLPGSGNRRAKPLGIQWAGVLSGKGIEIVAVEPASLAADAGVLAADLVVEVNGHSVKDMTPDALRSYLANKMAAGSSLMFGIERAGEIELVVVKPDWI